MPIYTSFDSLHALRESRLDTCACPVVFFSAARRDLVDNCVGEGGQYFQDTYKCFVLVETPSTWDTARSNCQALGAELAIITNEMESDFVRDNVLNGTSGWIGLSISAWNSATDFQAFYVDREPFPVTQTWGWYFGEPNDDGACVEFSGGKHGTMRHACTRSATSRY